MTPSAANRKSLGRHWGGIASPGFTPLSGRHDPLSENNYVWGGLLKLNQCQELRLRRWGAEERGGEGEGGWYVLRAQSSLPPQNAVNHLVTTKEQRKTWGVYPPQCLPKTPHPPQNFAHLPSVKRAEARLKSMQAMCQARCPKLGQSSPPSARVIFITLLAPAWFGARTTRAPSPPSSRCTYDA